MSDYFDKQHADDIRFVRRAGKKKFPKVTGEGKTVMQTYKAGEISEEEFLVILTFLDRNGYGKEQAYDLPYSYIKRILE